MTRKFNVTVYEHISDAFDCEIELEDCDGLEGDALDDALTEAIEKRRVDGDDKRCFVEIIDTDWDAEEIHDEASATA